MGSILSDTKADYWIKMLTLVTRDWGLIIIGECNNRRLHPFKAEMLPIKKQRPKKKKKAKTCRRISPLSRNTVKSEKSEGSLLLAGLWDKDPTPQMRKQNEAKLLSQIWNVNLFYTCSVETPCWDININTGAGPQWKPLRVPGSNKPQITLQGCFCNNGHVKSALHVHNKKWQNICN